MTKKQSSEDSYHIENGVLYVYGFKERPDYFKLGGFDGIRKLVLSDGIRVIPQGSFQLYPDLEEIVWPKGLRAIEGCSFMDCRSLKELHLPEVRLPDGITNIDYAAVGGNRKLRELVIPEEVTELNNSALIDDGALERVWKAERYFHKPEQELEAQLALCGVTPADIDTVVLSHLHEDHTGNARLFPHAALYAPKKEYLDAMWSVCTNPDTGYVKSEVTAPYREVHLIDRDFELLPGIGIVNLPGHTNGLLGMVLHTEKDGVLIFPQDAVFCEESYGPPARLPGGFEDSVACLASIEKVRRLQAQYGATVFFGHDPDNFPKYRHASAYYE